MLTRRTAHQLAWEQAKILHRDVSAGNILIYDPDDSADVDATDTRGLLADWDLAQTEKELLAVVATRATRCVSCNLTYLNLN